MEVREGTEWIRGGRMVWAEGTVCAKALGPEQSSFIEGAARGSM